MSITSNAGKTAAAAGNMFRDIGSAFTPTGWRNAANAAQQAAHEAANPGFMKRAWNGAWNGACRAADYTAGKVGGGIGWLITAPFRAAFAVGKTLVSVPLNLLVFKPARAIFGGIGSLYRNNPRAMSVLTVIGATLGIASFFTKARSQALQENFQASEAAVAAMPQSQYMNSVTPEESAALNAQMKNSAQPGHTAAVEAARTPVQAPESVRV